MKMTLKCTVFAAALALLGLPGCSSPAQVGESCGADADCDTMLSCFNRPGAEISPVCMADCDTSTTRVCDDGSVCLERMGGGLGVCYLGGDTAVGEACTGATQCAQGSVCVNTGSATQCATACVVGDGSRCAAGETCAELSSGGGFCQGS